MKYNYFLKGCIITLLYLIIICECSHHNDDHNHKRKNSRFQMMENLFELYNRSHGISALKEEAENQPSLLCQRKFVTGLEMSCGDFGNSNLKQFNGLLHAIILDRTFVTFKDIICPNTLLFQFGIPYYEDVVDLLRDAKCSNHNELYGKLADNAYLPVMNDRQSFGQDYDYLCYMDRVTQNVLSFYLGELSPYDLFKVCKGKLGEEATRRLNILFSHPYSDASYFESLGYAFMKLVDFTPNVYNYIQNILYELFPKMEISNRNINEMHFIYPKINNM